jgi:hypothetical protein
MPMNDLVCIRLLHLRTGTLKAEFSALEKPYMLWRQYCDGDRNDELAARAMPANALLDAAHIRLVDFDRTVETIPPWPHHGRAQLPQHGPGSLITSQSQQPLQPERAYPLLLVSYVPARGKPFLEEDTAVIATFQRTEENGPRK